MIIFKGLKIFKVDAQKIKGGPDLELLKKCLVLIFILRSGKKAPTIERKVAINGNVDREKVTLTIKS